MTLTDMDALRVDANGDVAVNADVAPSAAVTQVTGLYASLSRTSIRLKRYMTAVDSTANAALRKWLKQRVGVPQGKVEWVRGSTSQHKQLTVSYTANACWAAPLALLVKTGI